MSAPAAKRVRRPRTDPQTARETVLDAAESLLRSGGPGALRLGEIASLAGLSHSNVLYHFEGGMKELEAQLGRRIALRLSEELAQVHRDNPGPELPSHTANERLFEVLGQPDNARLIAWMLVSSKPEDLGALATSIMSTISVVADHSVFAGLPREAVMKEVIDETQLAIAAALGFGLIRPWVSSVFGLVPDAGMFVDKLATIHRERVARLEKSAAEVLTIRQ